MGYNSDGSRMREEFPEARIAMCKCKEAKGKTYGVRFQREGSGWRYTWAFEIEESVGRREGYNETEIVGDINPTSEYPGCPHCGVRAFVVCGACHKLNCNVHKGGVFSCEWCGNVGELSDYDGEGIASGGDRG